MAAGRTLASAYSELILDARWVLAGSNDEASPKLSKSYSSSMWKRSLARFEDRANRSESGGRLWCSALDDGFDGPAAWLCDVEAAAILSIDRQCGRCPRLRRMCDGMSGEESGRESRDGNVTEKNLKT